MSQLCPRSNCVFLTLDSLDGLKKEKGSVVPASYPQVEFASKDSLEHGLLISWTARETAVENFEMLYLTKIITHAFNVRPFDMISYHSSKVLWEWCLYVQLRDEKPEVESGTSWVAELLSTEVLLWTFLVVTHQTIPTLGQLNLAINSQGWMRFRRIS